MSWKFSGSVRSVLKRGVLVSAHAKLDVIPCRRGIAGRIFLIQSWSQLISTIVTLAVAFSLIFLIAYAIEGRIAQSQIIFLVSFGIPGGCVSLVEARQVSLVVQTEPRNVRYWLDKIDKSISSLGYRESQVVRDAGDLRRYLPTIPNFLLPLSRRGPSQLRPFVPRWSRWKENELEISWIQEDGRLQVTGPAVTIDRLIRRL